MTLGRLETPPSESKDLPTERRTGLSLEDLADHYLSRASLQDLLSEWPCFWTCSFSEFWNHAGDWRQVRNSNQQSQSSCILSGLNKKVFPTDVFQALKGMCRRAVAWAMFTNALTVFSYRNLSPLSSTWVLLSDSLLGGERGRHDGAWLRRS